MGNGVHRRTAAPCPHACWELDAQMHPLDTLGSGHGTHAGTPALTQTGLHSWHDVSRRAEARGQCSNANVAAQHAMYGPLYSCNVIGVALPAVQSIEILHQQAHLAAQSLSLCQCSAQRPMGLLGRFTG